VNKHTAQMNSLNESGSGKQQQIICRMNNIYIQTHIPSVPVLLRITSASVRGGRGTSSASLQMTILEKFSAKTRKDKP
jgi:hypothetical protein